MKLPKNDSRHYWTSHIKNKMLFYRISEQKIKSILKAPDRHEEGIAPNTFAAMKRNDTPKRKEEIWTMYQKRGGKSLMISAWRYPGKSQPGREIPIPEDILNEIKKAWF
jgi:hypothetical protein